jgi:hypothetical protein
MAVAHKFPWSKCKTFADIGPAEGCLLVQVALANAHLTGEGFDLSTVGPILEEYVASWCARSNPFRAGNLLHHPLPSADVLVMGMILHDWKRASGKRVSS